MSQHVAIHDDNQHKEATLTPEESVENALAELFRMSKARFGRAVKGYWLYTEETRPGCGREIDLIKIKGKEAISLNAFIHRKPGILIGYLLCKRYTRQIFQAAEKNPYQQIPLHSTIEKNLIAAYDRYRNSLPA